LPGHVNVNLLGDNIKKTAEAQINTTNEVGLEANRGKTKYTLMVCYESARQNID
jgi:hypothetical protein